jgi:di/tricarboxylate transporter
MEIALVIGLLAAAIVLFASEKFSVDVITIGFLAILTISGVLTPKEAFEGFSNDFIIILASIFVISGALSSTGVLDIVGSKMIRLVKKKILFVGFTMFFTSFLSAFMNNTTVTALVTGPVVGMCRKLSLSPSKVLIPVAFASILGGTCTLIGTSTNIAVSGYMSNAGLEPVGFFEILGIGLILFVTGFVFILIFWKSLLPDHNETSYIEDYNIKQYLSEIVISGKSQLVGQLAFQSDLARREIRIIKIIRQKEEIIPNRATRFETGDILLVECNLEDLIKVKEASGVEVLADTMADVQIQSDKIRLAEALIIPGSGLVDKSLKELRFRQNYDLVVLAMQHEEDILSQKIGDHKFRIGDVLLVQGTEEAIEASRGTKDLSILGDFKVTMFKERKGILSALIFIIAVIAGSLNFVPLSIAFLTAALAVVLIGALPADRVYQSIEWKLLILIGGMSAFGTAMDNSGAAEFLAVNIIHLLGDFGAIYVLGGFVLLVIILTQPMSNAAAALVVLPVAIETAQLLNADPRSFAIAIMLGASVSLITPFEPSCILVYGPGKYKFMDFIKIGVPLTIILFMIIMVFVPYFWPI